MMLLRSLNQARRLPHLEASRNTIISPSLTRLLSSTVSTGGNNAPEPVPELRLGPNLTKYGVNLNKQVLEGKIDPVVGRKKEIERTIQVLSRRTKNNPCLIGEPGVGKVGLLNYFRYCVFSLFITLFFFIFIFIANRPL